jgi:TP901 family phage tail tape measure protein
MPSGSVYELAILLTLKDLASGGFNRVETHLRSLGKEGQTTLKTFNALRSDLKKDLAVAGFGVGTLAMLRGGIKDAGNFEAATTDLRVAISQLSDGGATDVKRLSSEFGELERIGIRLGNTLPGSTQDFFEMFTVLRQGGLQTQNIIDGAGESVARLAVATHSVPKELAADYAQLAIQFKLGADEYGSAADLLAKLHGAIGFRPESVIEGAKFAQLRGGLPLGFRGMKGFETMATLLGSLKMAGLEGGIGGRELASLIFALPALSKAQKKADAALKHKGIDLKFFSSKGEFLGAENMISQMEKLKKLSAEERLTLVTKRFGSHEAVGPAVALAEAGKKGYDELMKRERQALPLQEKVNQITATYNAKLENLHGTIENLTATAFLPMLNTLKPILDFSNQTVGSLQQWSKVNSGVTQTVGTLVGMGGVTLTVVGGIGAMTTAWRMWRIASSIGVNEAGQLTFLRTLRTETAATSAVMTSGVGRAGLYGRTIGKIPTAVTTTIALVGVEYAITQVLGLIENYKELKAAEAGQTRAGYESLNSLSKVEADYQKRGERVPASVYSSRASDAVETLLKNPQLQQSLQPGGRGLLRTLYEGFTFQPVNPYARGPMGTFDAGWAGETFKKRAPELANVEVMRAFIAKLQQFKLPAEQQGQYQLGALQRADIGSALQQAFPQAYQQATQSLTLGLTNMAEPVNALPVPLSRIGEAATRSTGALDRFTNRLDGLEIPSFSNSGAPGATPEATPAHPFTIFPKTSFTPRAAAAILSDRSVAQGSGRSITIHGGLNVHVPAGSKAAEDPEEFMRFVEHAAEIQSERA